MTTKKTAKQKPSKSATDAAKAKTLKIPAQPDKSEDRLFAEAALSPVIGNTVTAIQFAQGSMGETDLSEACKVVRDEVEKIWKGDLSGLEATLTAQAINLDKIFNEMARRAASNMGQYRDSMEVYMKLALKAQSQCRTTLQTLAEIKNPQPLAFVKQANIVNGPQQINNGTPPPESPAEKNQNQPNELLEVNNGKRLDTRATQKTSGSDTAMATLE